ncbi:hypothetical protein HRbin24_01256 [bacterium HR24]|jgi:transporter family protein|nr:hypothetical protein HRbin24_01256 [bacterium HR24]
MEQSLLLALAAAVLFGCSDFVYKLSQLRRIAPPTFMMTQASFFLLCALSLMLVSGGPEFSNAVLGYGVMAGIMGYSALILFLRTLRVMEASTASTIFRLSFVPAALLALLWLSEPLGTGEVLGIVTAGLAIAMFSLPGAMVARAAAPLGAAGIATVGNPHRISVPGLLTLVLATVLWGTVAVVYKKAGLTGATAPTFLVFQATAFNVCAHSVALNRGEWGFRLSVMRYAVPAAVLQFLGVLSLFRSVNLGQVGVSATVSQLSFVLTALLSAVLLRERLTVNKVAGLALAVLAVVCFRLSL